MNTSTDQEPRRITITRRGKDFFDRIAEPVYSIDPSLEMEALIRLLAHKAGLDYQEIKNIILLLRKRGNIDASYFNAQKQSGSSPFFASDSSKQRDSDDTSAVSDSDDPDSRTQLVEPNKPGPATPVPASNKPAAVQPIAAAKTTPAPAALPTAPLAAAPLGANSGQQLLLPSGPQAKRTIALQIALILIGLVLLIVIIILMMSNNENDKDGNNADADEKTAQTSHLPPTLPQDAAQTETTSKASKAAEKKGAQQSADTTATAHGQTADPKPDPDSARTTPTKEPSLYRPSREAAALLHKHVKALQHRFDMLPNDNGKATTRWLNTAEALRIQAQVLAGLVGDEVEFSWWEQHGPREFADGRLDLQAPPSLSADTRPLLPPAPKHDISTYAVYASLADAACAELLRRFHWQEVEAAAPNRIDIKTLYSRPVWHQAQQARNRVRRWHLLLGDYPALEDNSDLRQGLRDQEAGLGLLAQGGCQALLHDLGLEVAILDVLISTDAIKDEAGTEAKTTDPRQQTLLASYRRADQSAKNLAQQLCLAHTFRTAGTLDWASAWLELDG